MQRFPMYSKIVLGFGFFVTNVSQNYTLQGAKLSQDHMFSCTNYVVFSFVMHVKSIFLQYKVYHKYIVS
jgi:hypothetical protein